MSGVDGSVDTLLLDAAADAAAEVTEYGLGGLGGGDGVGVAIVIAAFCGWWREIGFSCSGRRASVGSVDSGLTSSSGSR